MPKKKSYITASDIFCGAGGSSQGAEEAGAEIALAINHWKLAIDTHNTNFPNTLHDCTDASACDPRRYPTTDILIISPECKTHTPSGGNTHKQVKAQLSLYVKGIIDPATERSRATMWDVPRFAEYHNYNAIIVENVIEAKTRWPLFDNWLGVMHTIGYNHKCLYLNSMHFQPTPQSRDRMYVVFWKKGNKAPKLDYTPSSWCGKCEKNINAIQSWKKPDAHFGKYRKQYIYCCPSCSRAVEPYYYAAFNCIDWSDIGERIGERKTPLSPNTIARIEYGLYKYGKYPFQVVNYTPGYSKPITDPTGSITCQDHHGILSPFIVKLEHSQRANNAKSVTMEAATQTTRQSGMLISPNSRPAFKELPTQTTCQGMGIITPFITELRGTSKVRPIGDALSTVTAGGNHHGLVATASWNSFLAQYYSTGHCTKHISEELGTVTTGDRSGLVNYKSPNIEDCNYRMLKPHEIKLAMAFREYYTVLGNGRDQVKQLGNAVTPPVMKWLTERVIESLN